VSAPRRSARPAIAIVSAAGVLVLTLVTLAVTEARRTSGTVRLGTDGIVFQRQANDCGLAAMEMVGRALGAGWTPAQLAGEIPLSERGASMLALQQFAERHGVKATGWQLNLRELTTIRPPAIAFVDGHHYVVLTSVDADRVIVEDPGTGRLQMPVRTFARHWRGEVLTFEPVRKQGL
jgi:ATP-binding cassette, subfamily B, bacterial CvaB/MchF/RaxB